MNEHFFLKFHMARSLRADGRGREDGKNFRSAERGAADYEIQQGGVRAEFSIAIPENNAKNSAPQSVNYCVTDFRRTPVRLQICSLQFALCSTAFFALFSGLAIDRN